MKLADLTEQILARAVEIYAEIAYGKERPEQVLKALSIRGSTYRELLAQMDDEGWTGDAPHRRYALRLGNPRYPCMKLVFEEMLFDGEFFFLVDTHDELELEPGFPDYEDWQELRRFNRDLKAKIERALAEAGLPTVEDMRRLAAEDAAVAEAVPRGKKVLVALRSLPESTAVALELSSHGYEATVAPESRPIIETISELLPDAVLVSASRDAPRLAEKLRALRLEKGLPIKLVISFPYADRRTWNRTGADAFIVEPVEKETLFRTLDRLWG